MKKIVRIIIVLLLISIVAVFWIKNKKAKSDEIEYQFTDISKGNIENLVSCTGTLNPMSIIDVGTQVSGTVEQVLVDFNDIVKEGQILAILDQRQLKVNYKQATANLEKSQSNYNYLEKKYENAQELSEQNMIAKLDLDKALNDKISAKASLVSAESQLEENRLDLEEYSVIRSPINGIVISRDIEPGQTVAASLSSPTLFMIAEDLATMEIYALVDESDIGMIEKGQSVSFNVDAYSEEEFVGLVNEIRLQPDVISNVVTYTVIVEAENRDDILLPGMTANVDFIIEFREDVYCLANSALKFTPPMEELQAFMEKKRAGREGEKNGEQRPDGRKMGEDSGHTRSNGMRNFPANMGKVWFLDDNNDLALSMVKIGATDGSKTEITDLGRLDESAKIIMKSSGGSGNSGDPKSNMRMMRMF